MKFKNPRSPMDLDWGFYRRGCADRESRSQKNRCCCGDIEQMIRILALDLGTKTGFAIRSATLNHGFVNFKRKSKELEGAPYLRFKKWLTELKQADIDIVCYEKVERHVSTYSAQMYGGYKAILMAWCEHHGIPYRGVGVGVIKKHFTGKGNAKKEEMIIEARKRFGDIKDDNEADALAILDYAERHELL